MQWFFSNTLSRRPWLVALVALMLATMVAAAPAQAAKVRFGSDETLHKIADVSVKSEAGEALYLGYKTTMQNFVLPYTISDDGYILGVVGQDKYYSLTPEQISGLQAEGSLPNPLPTYSVGIDTVDWWFGHSAWVLLGSMGLWLGWSMWRSGKQKAAIPLVEAGNTAMAAGQHDEAVQRYGEALAISPNVPEIRMLRANALYASGAPDKAIADLSAVIAKNGKNAEALLRRGLLFAETQNPKAAIADLDRAIKLAPSAPLRLTRARFHLEKGDGRAAMKDLDAVAKEFPADAGVLELMARAYDLEGATADAATARNRAAVLRSTAGP